MRLTVLLVVMILVGQITARGQSDIEEPERQHDLTKVTCSVYNEVVEAEDGRSEVLFVWAHGYWTGQKGVTEKNAKEPLSWSNLEVFVEKLNSVCTASPEKLWVAAIREVR